MVNSLLWPGLQHVTLIVVRPRLVVGQCALHRLHHPESDGWGSEWVTAITLGGGWGTHCTLGYHVVKIMAKQTMDNIVRLFKIDNFLF